MHTATFIREFLLFIETYRLLAYAAIFVAALFIGNLLSFVILWIALHHRFGTHPLILVILTLFLAHLTADTLWYWCGRALRGTRLGVWIWRHLPKHDSLERHIRENCFKWTFLAEFLPYSAFPVFFMVGWTQVKFRNFFAAMFPAVCTSFTVLLLVTYFLVSSLSALEAATAFRHLEVVFAVAFVLFLLVSYILRLFIKKEFAAED